MATEVGTTNQSTYMPTIPLPPESLYSPAKTGGALNEVENGFESAEPSHVDRFVDGGYVVVRRAFNSVQVQCGLDCIDRLAGEQNEAFNRACDAMAKCKPLMAFGRGEPAMQFEESAQDFPKGERAHLIRKLQNYHDYEDGLKMFSESATMKKFCRELIDGPGSDIELEIFQSLALLKPAKVGREKPWHQDHAYFNVHMKKSRSGAPTEVLGIWIALEEATVENGCMHILPGWHVSKGPIIHFQICDTDVPPCVPVEMKPGDALFFSSLLPHGTPPNLSNKSRRAIQYHLVPKGMERTSEADRLEVFGSEGKSVEC